MDDTININDDICIDALKNAYKQGYTVPIDEKDKVINNIIENIKSQNSPLPPPPPSLSMKRPVKRSL